MKGFKSVKILFVFTAMFLLHHNNAQIKKTATTNKENKPSLKEDFKNYFFNGAALNTTQIEEKDASSASLIPQQFNSTTPENMMKAEVIHPEWNKNDLIKTQ